MGNFGLNGVSRKLVIIHLVPLATRRVSKERKIMIGEPTFNESKCGGNPEISNSKKFKNSVGNSTS